MVFYEKTAITSLKLIQIPKVGGVLENSGYLLQHIISTEIFKIEEAMTEKMKPQVANPPLKIGRIFCSQYTHIDPLTSLRH